LVESYVLSNVRAYLEVSMLEESRSSTEHLALGAFPMVVGVRKKNGQIVAFSLIF